MKKKMKIFIAVVIILILLTPFPSHYKDGGTVKYTAILYSVTDYHSIVEEGFYTGIEVKILGITVYKNTTIESR